MTKLTDFILRHTKRGECQCGKHTADLVFFKVAMINNPDAQTLVSLIPTELLDGKEHSYIEIGGILGDQGIALQLMGLGTLLGIWELVTPRKLGFSEDIVMKLAGIGYVTVKTFK
jgi:hypothetical protein